MSTSALTLTRRKLSIAERGANGDAMRRTPSIVPSSAAGQLLPSRGRGQTDCGLSGSGLVS